LGVRSTESNRLTRRIGKDRRASELVNDQYLPGASGVKVTGVGIVAAVRVELRGAVPG